jgi:hypothetical protein
MWHVIEQVLMVDRSSLVVLEYILGSPNQSSPSTDEWRLNEIIAVGCRLSSLILGRLPNSEKLRMHISNGRHVWSLQMMVFRLRAIIFYSDCLVLEGICICFKVKSDAENGMETGK